MSRLGIVVVHYFAESLLRRSLEALQSSTFEAFEAVVVDNGSAESLAWVEEDARFSLLTSGSNLGFAAGTNRGIARIGESADCLLLLNPDVVLEPDAVELLVRVLDEIPAVGAVGGCLVLPGGGLDRACRRAEPTPASALAKLLRLSRLAPRSRRLAAYNLGHLDPLQPADVDSGTGACLLLRRSALREVGSFLDERFFLYGEDLDLCRRLRQAGWRIRYEPAARGLHVKGSGRIRSPRVTVEFYRAMWRYYRKWGGGRRNPVVLGGLVAALALFATAELIRNEGRRLVSRLR